MSKCCIICKKTYQKGMNVSRKGQYKAKGGTGSKISRRTKRFFLSNLQRIKAKIDGVVKRVYVCTRCLKANKIQKA